MSTPGKSSRSSALRRLIVWLKPIAVLLAMTLLVLWLSGLLHERIPATVNPDRRLRTLPADVSVLTMTTTSTPIVEEAVGSIRAVQQVELASRLLARIVELGVTGAGQPVKKGDVLVKLEDADLRARVLEAKAARQAAEDSRALAEGDLERARQLHAEKIVSERELQQQTTRLANAVAEVERLAQAVIAAETMLGFAVLRSPIDGIVIDKLVESGDTVTPGQPLMRLYDPTRMQLVASVRERLANRLRIDDSVEVAVDALGLRCHGTVSEIVPQTTAASRTFDVKVTGPCPDGVFTGMFGRVMVPLGNREVLSIPRSAIESVGQIDHVFVVREDSSLARRFVVLGEPLEDRVEVLSGLAVGERIVANANSLREASRR
jgi:RND family efflux transporter MFP subunit